MKRWSIWFLNAITMVVVAFSSIASAETVLKVWAHHHPPRVEKTQALFDEFEQLNPDIKIEFTTMPYDAYWNKLLPSMAAGTGPDVLHMHERDAREPVLPDKLQNARGESALGQFPGNTLPTYKPRIPGPIHPKDH